MNFTSLIVFNFKMTKNRQWVDAYWFAGILDTVDGHCLKKKEVMFRKWWFPNYNIFFFKKKKKHMWRYGEDCSCQNTKVTVDKIRLSLYKYQLQSVDSG